MHEDQKALIEVVIRDTAGRFDQARESTGLSLRVHELVEVEDHVENDIHPDQHKQADEIVLQKVRENISIENSHRRVQGSGVRVQELRPPSAFLGELLFKCALHAIEHSYTLK